MGKNRKVILAIIVASFLAGFYFYPRMPERIASHWNIRGEVDGYLPKFWGLFLMPLVSVGLFLLFLAVPKIDPLKRNIEKFRKYYEGFVALVIAFLFYLYLLTIAWSIGVRFEMIQMLSPAFGILFYYCGVLVEKAKRNWFIGIRTPWTLSSDRVWDKTHRVGGKMFKAAGGLALLGTFFPQYALFFVLFPALFVALYTVIYSYLEYRKEAG